jgi:hypothetical protein
MKCKKEATDALERAEYNESKGLVDNSITKEGFLCSLRE